MIQYPLRLHDGHLLIDTPTGAWLVDTGAPASFGRAQPELRVGEGTVHASYMGLDASTLSGFVGADVSGLLGADILGCQDLMVDIPGRMLGLGDMDDPPIRTVIPVRWFMGIPIVSVAVDGSAQDVFFDTGAPLSYLQSVDLGSYPDEGEAADFYPGFGSFSTATARIPVQVGDETLALRCGQLPGLLGMTLMMAGCSGIIGTEMILGRRAVLSPGRSELALD